MTIDEFRIAHKVQKFIGKRFFEFNGAPSQTDPTQDIPVKRLQLAANGVPINVRQHNMSFTEPIFNNGKKIDIPSYRQKNRDNFDVVSDLQAKEQQIRDYKPQN